MLVPTERPLTQFSRRMQERVFTDLEGARALRTKVVIPGAEPTGRACGPPEYRLRAAARDL
jgi:hypothetical protein